MRWIWLMTRWGIETAAASLRALCRRKSLAVLRPARFPDRTLSSCGRARASLTADADLSGNAARPRLDRVHPVANRGHPPRPFPRIAAQLFEKRLPEILRPRRAHQSRAPHPSYNRRPLRAVRG